MNYIIKNEYYEATISSLGAELISLKNASGKELMWQSPSKEIWSKHAPLLFPVAGRLKDGCYTYQGAKYFMGIHGFISKTEFSDVAFSESKIRLTTRANAETLKVYPFNFEFSVEYSLTADTLKAEVTVTNLDEKVMPYSFGWHPAFMLLPENGIDIGSYSLFFGDGVESISWMPLAGPNAHKILPDFKTPGGKYVFDEKQIYEQDTMIFSDVPTSLRLSSKNGCVLDMSWSENTPYLCIWKWPTREANYICLEPWSALPQDGAVDECFDTRPMNRLLPSSSEIFYTTYKFTV